MPITVVKPINEIKTTGSLINMLKRFITNSVVNIRESFDEIIVSKGE